MTDRARDLEISWERGNLAKSDRDIVEGEGRITRQTALVERLRGHGQTVTEAERLLETLHQTLELWRDHREAILRRIAYLEDGRVGHA